MRAAPKHYTNVKHVSTSLLIKSKYKGGGGQGGRTAKQKEASTRRTEHNFAPTYKKVQ